MKLKDETIFVQAQLIHERLADIAIDLYACACVLSRLDALIAKPKPGDRFADATAGQTFLKMAFRRVRANFVALDDNDDEAWLASSAAMLGKW